MRNLTVYSLIVIVLGSVNTLWAQVDMEYWDNGGNISFYGGGTYPNEDFGSTRSSGLFAQNGYNVGVDGHYIIGYGMGVGAELGVDWFNLDDQAFASFANPESMTIRGSYSSTFFGINAVANLPIVIDEDYFTINLFAIGTPGLRGMRIPNIDLTYHELDNKYVEVSYRPRTSTMGYLSFRGGIQFIISNSIGIMASYKRVLRSQHSVFYSVRRFDANEQLYEDEEYLRSYFDMEGFQVGLTIPLGVN